MNQPSKSQQIISLLTVLVGVVICVLLVVIYFAVRKIDDKSAAEPGDDQGQARFVATMTEIGQHVMQRVGPSCVLITSTNKNGAARPTLGPDGTEYGTGIIVRTEGYVLTCLHVVSDANRITVKLRDGRILVADLLASDEESDLALLKIDAEQLPVVSWSDTSQLQVGMPVWSLGNPFGMEWSLSSGIVSGTQRRNVGKNPKLAYLQTDAATNPGSSGGPLVNQDGEVLGMNSVIVGRQFRGVSLAVPAETVRRVLEELLRKAEMERR